MFSTIFCHSSLVLAGLVRNLSSVYLDAHRGRIPLSGIPGILSSWEIRLVERKLLPLNFYQCISTCSFRSDTTKFIKGPIKRQICPIWIYDSKRTAWPIALYDFSRTVLCALRSSNQMELARGSASDCCDCSRFFENLSLFLLSGFPFLERDWNYGVHGVRIEARLSASSLIKLSIFAESFIHLKYDQPVTK